MYLLESFHFIIEIGYVIYIHHFTQVRHFTSDPIQSEQFPSQSYFLPDHGIYCPGLRNLLEPPLLNRVPLLYSPLLSLSFRLPIVCAHEKRKEKDAIMGNKMDSILNWIFLQIFFVISPLTRWTVRDGVKGVGGS